MKRFSPFTSVVTGRNSGASNHTVFEQNLDLNGRVAPGIKNFASADCLDQSHGRTPLKNYAVVVGCG